MTAFLTCRNVCKWYGDHCVLPGISLSLSKGSITALIGASGCGKSTLLHLLAGFSSPDSGAIRLAGVPCTTPGPDRVMVFQDDALFPWLSVEENVALGLKTTGVPAAACREQVNDMLCRVGLADRGSALPSAVSGGMRQRVALARALVLRPNLLLLDEPFAALDAITRARMQSLLVRLQRDTGVTVLMVTHDVAEACLLADTVLLLETGAGITHSLSIPLPRPRDPEDPALAPLRQQLRRQLGETMLQNALPAG